MSQHQSTLEAAGSTFAAAFKAYPVAVAGASFLGFGLQDWVYLTAIAVALCNLVVFGARLVRWLRALSANGPGQ